MAKSINTLEKKSKKAERPSDLPVGVRRHDFRIARKMNQSQRIWFGGLHSRLAAQLAKYLEEIFHCETELAFMGLEQVQGSDFVEQDHKDTITSNIALQPGTGHMYLIWPRDMAFFIIEKLLGGSGDVLFTDKELSEFEKDILKRFTKITFQALQEVFEDKPAPQGNCEAIQEGPESFSGVLPYEVLLLGSLNVRINGHQGKLTLVYPYSVVKSWVEEPAPFPEATADSMTSPQTKDGAHSALEKTPLVIRVRLSNSKIKVSDFSNLQEGDCLQLNHSIREPFDVFVDKRAKFKGYLGQSGNQLAIKLVAPQDEPKDAGKPDKGENHGKSE
ncbi:FliM/FliN family flagellar motor switch protein [bacterium]|nr:FliM/FliN family flagellar motor switch protein [bacterium]